MSGAHRFSLLSFDRSRAVKEGQTLVVTVSLALLSGWLLSQLRLPAPYMLGALLGVWGVGTLCRPIQPWLGVPRWFHVPVVLGLGVIVGAAIGPGFLQSLQAWWLTALVLLLATLAASALGFLFLWRYAVVPCCRHCSALSLRLNGNQPYRAPLSGKGLRGNARASGAG